MPELPKLTEESGKVVFASNDDYSNVTKSYIEDGKNVEAIQRLLNRENVVIKETPKPEASQAPAQEPVYKKDTPPNTSSNATTTLIERLKKKAELENINLDYRTDDEIIDALLTKEKRVQYLENEKTKLQNTSALSSAEKDELSKIKTELAELKKGQPAQSPAPAKEAPKASKKMEIDFIREKISKIEDKLSSEAVDLQNQLTGLILEEQDSLRSQISSAGSAEMAQLRKELQETKELLKEQQKAVLEEKSRISTENERNREMEAIKTFQERNKQFHTKKSMLDIDKEYIKWANELHQLKYGRPGNGPAEWKDVVSSYLNHDVDLERKAQRAGLEKPAEVDRYLEICDLLRLRTILNEATGEDHTLEQVWIYKIGRNGTIDDVMSQQRALGAEALKAAQNKRDTDFAKQLDHVAGDDKGGVGEEMTVEQAQQILKTISPTQAARDKKLGDLYDKATARLTKMA